LNEIKRLRQERKLSLRKLSEAAGIDKVTLIRAERGESVTLNTLEKIAKALEVDIRDLLPKEDAPQPHELTLEWLLGADSRDRHTALQASTAEERERLVEEIDAELASLKEKHAAALTDSEREAIMERASRVSMMRPLATFGPAVLPVRSRERVGRNSG
jgi:transcriptional regulator with XRE-family HTH domain